MAFLDQVREAARQQALRGTDDWYYKEFPYVLELSASGPAAAELGGQVYFTLPLGPEEYSLKRVMRQSVTPTMGGLIPEEAGLLWAEIRLSGTFGLQLKGARDTTGVPGPIVGDPFLGSAGLSGPGWTQRMLRNVFERYASLKANPTTGPFVQMIWHDLKTQDHWVVVPETVDIPRTAARRHQYPYHIELKGIAKKRNRTLLDGVSSLKGFGKIKQIIQKVNEGQTIVRAAVAQATAYVSEVSFYVESIGNVIDNLSRAADALSDFVSGQSETVTLGKVFMISAAVQLETALLAMEEEPLIPAAVRATFLEALDGLHLSAAQIAAFGRTYAQQIDGIQAIEAGAANDSSATLTAAKDMGAPSTMTKASRRRERVNDQDLVEAGATNRPRLRGTYTSFVEYAIRDLDSLTSIAARYLGDGSLWYDLAILNGLQAPYIVASRPPGTVGPGDVIVVPTRSPEITTAVVAGEGNTTGETILGVDIALFEDVNSIPGSPAVDIAVDRRTYKDCRVIRGLDNLKQALQLRTWTEQGAMPLVPEYGVARQIGVKAVDNFLTLLRLSIEEAIRQDSRVKRIGAVRFDVQDDAVEIDIDVIPIGSDSTQNVTLAVV